jgi:hypothetical protein
MREDRKTFFIQHPKGLRPQRFPKGKPNGHPEGTAVEGVFGKIRATVVK